MRKPYRVIFNCDGNTFYDGGDDLTMCLQNTFGPLEHTQVDALFWCDGSGGNTARYDSDVLELAEQRFNRADPALVKMIREGNDPPRAVVREAGKRGLAVFYSLRMNDVHDIHPRCYHTEYPRFKERHPEWMLQTGNPYGRYSSLDFALPEVRELKARIIEEIFAKYDFDGIELDFMRSPPYFKPGEETRHAGLLTEFLQHLRAHLDHRGRERGRPIEVAVSVNESLEANSLDGFDIRAWVEQRLIDHLVVGKGNIEIALEEFADLTRDTGIFVYPCLYGYPGDYNPRLPVEMARGLALNYWKRGCQGIYLFNWAPHQNEWADLAGMLREVGDPNTVNVDTVLFPAENARAPGSSAPPECPHGYLASCLPVPLVADQSIEATVFVGMDCASPRPRGRPKSLELRVTCTDISDDVVLRVSLNGHRVSEARTAEEAILKEDFNTERSVWERFQWGTYNIVRKRYPLTPPQIVCGNNSVVIEPMHNPSPKTDPKGDRAASVRRIEIVTSST